MSSDELKWVWVFCGEGARFPSGVFGSLATAKSWVASKGLSGLLTSYPVDVGVYGWAVDGGHFEPRRGKHQTARFIQGFTTSALPHHHFEDGVLLGDDHAGS